MGENLKESVRWFKQAEKDLKVAKNSIQTGYYEWTCFQAALGISQLKKLDER